MPSDEWSPPRRGDPRDVAIRVVGVGRRVIDRIRPDEDLPNRRFGALHADTGEFAARAQVEHYQEQPARIAGHAAAIVNVKLVVLIVDRHDVSVLQGWLGTPLLNCLTS